MLLRIWARMVNLDPGTLGNFLMKLLEDTAEEPDSVFDEFVGTGGSGWTGSGTAAGGGGGRGGAGGIGASEIISKQLPAVISFLAQSNIFFIASFVSSTDFGLFDSSE